MLEMRLLENPRVADDVPQWSVRCLFFTSHNHSRLNCHYMFGFCSINCRHTDVRLCVIIMQKRTFNAIEYSIIKMKRHRQHHRISYQPLVFPLSLEIPLKNVFLKIENHNHKFICDTQNRYSTFSSHLALWI